MSELDKTIEELEAEVQNELSEAEMKKDTSAPAKGAVAAEPMKKMDSEDDDAEDTGAAVTSTDDKKKDYAKKVKSDGSIPTKVKGDEKPQKLAAQYEGYTDDEIRDLCHSKDHDCATVVEHPIWGLGKPIERSHAIPDDNGFVEWYDVQFKHGVEEKVMAEDMKILKNANHNKEDKHMTKGDMLNAMNMAMKKMKKDELQATYDAMMNKEEPTDEQMELEGLSKAKEAIEKRLASINVKEDVDALVQGEDLSEEFQAKAATIFEAAVKSIIRPEVERIEEEKSQEIA